MLPHGRGRGSSNPSTGNPSISDKEEIARAALRSLAGPSTSPTSSQPPLLSRAPSYPPARQLPPPSQPTFTRRSRDHSRHSLHHDSRYKDGTSYADADPPASYSSTLSAREQARQRSGSTAASAAMTRDSSSSSFFPNQSLAASPESSPRLQPAPTLPPPPSRPYTRHSIPTSSFPTPSQVHETALRRASFALGVNLEEVRQIVRHAYAPPHSRYSSSNSASTSSSGQPHMPSFSTAEREASFTRQVLHAYQLESDRASQPRPPYDARPVERHPDPEAAPSGMTWHPANHPSDRLSQSPFPAQSDRSSLVEWGSRPEARLPTFETRLSEASSRPVPEHPRWQEPAVTDTRSAIPSTAPPPRSESPSPFAYDAYRRTSHIAPDSDPISTFKPAPRVSHGFVDDVARSRALDYDYAASRWQSHPDRHPQPEPDPLYQRKVRSIDDYVDESPYSQQLRQRSGSMAYQSSRVSGPLPQEDDRLPDRSVRSSFRHSYQPYPSQSSRYPAAPSAVATASSRIESPQLSPTMPDSQRFQNLSRMRSPAAETAVSVASSSVASAAALSPSPLLGAASSSSTSLLPERAHRNSAVDSEARSSLRAVSEDTAAESTRAGVESMQIDDENTGRKAPKPLPRKSRSLRSSFSHSDRSSVPIQGTDLSHSEIMQKLQNKVKSRLAAKGRASLFEGSSKSNEVSTASAGLGRAGSTTKRSASNAAQSSPSERERDAASVSSPQGSQISDPSRITTTAEKSAAPVAGIPAAKVRRTSAPSQQKPAVESTPPSPSKLPPPAPKSSGPPPTIEAALRALSPKPPSKPASPGGKSDSVPSSIEAALLSPTDAPTPSEAANLHARRLSRSPLPPEGAVETATGQALPAEIPAAGQMNASSATKQQSSKSGIDSLIQAANKGDPTETNSAIA